jgi:PAS domain-containing protein
MATTLKTSDKPTELPEDDLLLYEAESSDGGRFLIVKPASAPRTGISELDEQQEVVYSLRRRGQLVFSVPNDEERDKGRAATAKRAGLLKGASDIVWVRDSQTVFIEMKRTGESISAIKPEQVAFLGKTGQRGHLSVVCFGFRAGRFLVNNIDSFTTYCRHLNGLA